MDIYKYLHLDKLDCCVAIIKMPAAVKWEKRHHEDRVSDRFYGP